MAPARKLSATVAALSIALGLGMLIHAGGPARVLQDRSMDEGQAKVDAGAQVSAAPTITDVSRVDLINESLAIVSAESEDPPSDQLQSVGLRSVPDTRPAKLSIPEAPCVITSRATPEPGAIVRLKVTASCLPDSRVTVHHNGLLFTDRTDAHGRLEVAVPALAERAVFMLTFAGDQMAMAVTHVPDLADYHRVVLQWQGHGGVRLHAQQADDGAIFGQADGVTRLGNPDTPAPMLADIVSFPAANSQASSDLRVAVLVDDRTCGREVEARMLRLVDTRHLQTRKVEVSLPGCDAVGDFVVLSDVFEDLRMAAR